MAMSTASDVIIPEIFAQAVQAELKDNAAFMKSGLVSSGAVIVNNSFPLSGQSAVGNIVTVPYWNTLSGFVANADGSAITPQKLTESKEQATCARVSMAIQATRWSETAGAYTEGARQLGVRASDFMDKTMISTACASLPTMTVTLGTTLNWNGILQARAKFGDSSKDTAALIIHSKAEFDLSTERAATNGLPLLVDPQTGKLTIAGGMQIVVSDGVPVTGTPGVVSANGTTPPTVTVTGTSNRHIDLRVECTSIAGGATLGLWTGRYSTDNGGSWIAFTSAASVPVNDSFLSQENGLIEATGLTFNIAAGSAAVNNYWTSATADQYTSVIAKKGAMTFWYNAAAMSPQAQRDVLSDSDILASHIYYVGYRYKRVQGSNRPGIVLVKHN